MLEDGYVDTQQDWGIDIYPDFYIVSSPADIDFSSIRLVDQPINGIAWVDTDWGVIVYEPDPGFYGFDAVSYTIDDVNGETSNVAWIYLYVEPEGSWRNSSPLIVSFVAEKRLDDLWTFSGIVFDENYYGLPITFGGLLEGSSTTVNDIGHFYFTVPLPPTTEGPVTAETVDEFGAPSNLAIDLVLQP